MDTRTIVDRVRAFAVEGGNIDAAELHGIAADYARVCGDINARLRRCMDYLRRGLRSEAVHLAELQPLVLDEFAMADVPERDAWISICQANSLPMPQPLLVDEAGELNAAYGEEQRLAPLIKSNRVMALARARLPARIEVLRELAVLEPQGVWELDLVELEKARLTQIQEEAGVAYKAGDLATLEQLRAELAEGWRSPLPAKVVSRVEQAAATLRAQEGERRLRAMRPQIDEAYAAMAGAECARLVGEWQSVVAQYGVSLSAELTDYISPVVGWVNGQRAQAADRRETAMLLAELEQLIDSSSPIDQVERVHKRLVAKGADLPEALQRSYRTACTQDQLRTRRRRTRNIAVIAVLLLSVVGGVGFIVWRTVEQGAADSLARAVDTAVDAGNLAEAEKLVASTETDHPRRLQQPVVKAALGRLAAAQNSESSRIRDFEATLGLISSSPVERLAEPVSRLESLARSDDERKQAAEARQRMETALAERRAEHERRITAVLSEWSQLMREIDGADHSNPQNEVSDLLARARRCEADVLAIGVPDVQLKTAVDTLSSRLHRASAEHERRVRHRTQWATVRAAAGGPPDLLAAALRNFADQCADSPLATEVSAALQLQPQWMQVAEWQNLLTKWSPGIPADVASVKARREELDAYLKKHSSTPYASVARAYDGLLEAIVHVCDPAGETQKKLREVMNSPLVRDLKLVRTGEGFYYVPEGPANEPKAAMPGRAQFKAVLTPDIDDVRPITVAGSVVLEASPQSLAAKKITERLNRLRPDNAATLFPELVEYICSERDMDPVFAAILLRALDAIQQPVPMIKDVDLTNVSQSLEAIRVERLMWMNPKDIDSNRVRPAAQTELLRLVDHAARRQRLLAQQAAILQPLRPGRPVFGLLDAFDGSKQWYSSKQPRDGSTVLAVRLVDGAPAELLVVGTVEAGTVKLNSIAASLPAGSLLFAMEPALDGAR